MGSLFDRVNWKYQKTTGNTTEEFKHEVSTGGMIFKVIHGEDMVENTGVNKTAQRELVE